MIQGLGVFVCEAEFVLVVAVVGLDVIFASIEDWLLYSVNNYKRRKRESIGNTWIKTRDSCSASAQGSICFECLFCSKLYTTNHYLQVQVMVSIYASISTRKRIHTTICMTEPFVRSFGCKDGIMD